MSDSLRDEGINQPEHERGIPLNCSDGLYTNPVSLAEAGRSHTLPVTASQISLCSASCNPSSVTLIINWCFVSCGPTVTFSGQLKLLSKRTKRGEPRMESENWTGIVSKSSEITKGVWAGCTECLHSVQKGIRQRCWSLLLSCISEDFTISCGPSVEG